MRRFRRILFVAQTGCDNAPTFRRATALAENNQAQLAVVAAVDVGRSNSALRNALIEEQHQLVESLVRDAPSQSLESRVIVGTPFVELIKEVLRNEHDLLIKPMPPKEKRPFTGTDLKLLRKCPCPVWLLKSTQKESYRKIIAALAYDAGNPEIAALNRQLLEMASSLAISEFAELDIVHVWRLEHEAAIRSPRLGLSKKDVDEMVDQEERQRRQWLSNLVGSSRTSLGQDAVDYLQPQLHLIEGIAEIEVAKCADRVGAELVVMGTVGRTGIPGVLIGNTAEEILYQIQTSVLAVKPPGFVSPVTIEQDS